MKGFSMHGLLYHQDFQSESEQYIMLCPIFHFPIPISYLPFPLLLNFLKNSLSNAEHSSSNTPFTTSHLWLSLLSSIMLYNEPQAPAFESEAPKTTFLILAKTLLMIKDL